MLRIDHEIGRAGVVVRQDVAPLVDRQVRRRVADERVGALADGEGRLILRDGSTATIRPSKQEDRDALRAFFAHLSPESRRMRFFSPLSVL